MLMPYTTLERPSISHKSSNFYSIWYKVLIVRKYLHEFTQLHRPVTRVDNIVTISLAEVEEPYHFKKKLKTLKCNR